VRRSCRVLGVRGAAGSCGALHGSQGRCFGIVGVRGGRSCGALHGGGIGVVLVGNFLGGCECLRGVCDSSRFPSCTY